MASPHITPSSYSPDAHNAPSLAGTPPRYVLPSPTVTAYNSDDVGVSPPPFAATTAGHVGGSRTGGGYRSAEPNRRGSMHSTRTTRRSSNANKCDVEGCAEEFKTRKELVRHKSRAHRTGTAWRCNRPGCVKADNSHIFNRQDNFKRHLKTHRDSSDADYVERMVMSCAFHR